MSRLSENDECFRLTRISITIVGVFICCHLPRFIPNIIEMLVTKPPEVRNIFVYIFCVFVLETFIGKMQFFFVEKKVSYLLWHHYRFISILVWLYFGSPKEWGSTTRIAITWKKTLTQKSQLLDTFKQLTCIFCNSKMWKLIFFIWRWLDFSLPYMFMT
jgi:hypothetical protein